MEGPFSAYQGAEPYAFVSYAHDDGDAVFPDMLHLHNKGFRLWYDEGIRAGHNWAETLANKISGCRALLYFASRNSSASAHCQRELHFAMDANKPIVVVHVDQQPLPAAVRFVLGSQQAIMKQDLSTEGYNTRLTDGLSQHLSPNPNPNPGVQTGSNAEEVPLRFDSRRLTTIAILPFTPVGGDETLRQMADYCSEELSQLMSMDMCATVLSRRAVAKYADGNQSPVEIGQELSAGYVLEGSIRQIANEYRISIELVDTTTGITVASPRTGVTASGGEGFVASALDRLRDSLSDEMIRALAEATANLPDEQLDALALLARTPFPRYGFDRDSPTYRRLLEMATEIEPMNPWAHAQMAWFLSNLVNQGLSVDRERDKKLIYEHVDAALKYGANRAPVLGVTAHALRFVNDNARALELGRRCFSLIDALPARITLVRMLLCCGQAEEAMSHLNVITEQTPPGYPLLYGELRSCYMLMERWEEAEKYAALDAANQHHHVIYLSHACVLAELDKIDEATDAVNKARALFPGLKLKAAVKGFKQSWGDQIQFYRGLQKLHDLGVQ